MPRFFIDIDDGVNTTYDDHGSDYSDFQSARRGAIQLLSQTVLETLIDEAPRHFRVLLRDGQRKVVYRATYSFRELKINKP